MAALVLVLAVADRSPEILADFARPAVALTADLARQLGVDPPRWAHSLWAHPALVFHLIQWAVLAFGATMIVSGQVRVLASAIGLFAASILVEVLQGELSATREFDTTDVIANGIGVVVGVAIALAFTLAVSAIGRRRRWVG